jgi:DNA-binding transcriptional MerR regulator
VDSKTTQQSLDELIAGPDRIDATTYRIGDMSREFHVTLRALRFYETKGLLKPAKSGVTRHYSYADRVRLKVILLAKQFGLSLAEIRKLVEAIDGKTGTPPLRNLLDKFRDQQVFLEQQKAEAEAALAKLRETIGILEKAIGSDRA